MVFAIPYGPAPAGPTRSVNARRRLNKVAQSALSANVSDHGRPFDPPLHAQATPPACPQDDFDCGSNFEAAILASASSPQNTPSPLTDRFKSFDPAESTQARLKDFLA